VLSIDKSITFLHDTVVCKCAGPVVLNVLSGTNRQKHERVTPERSARMTQSLTFFSFTSRTVLIEDIEIFKSKKNDTVIAVKDKFANHVAESWLTVYNL
jgi:hypothetical protein